MTRKADLKLLTLAGAMRQQEKPGVARSVVNRILDLIRTGMLRAGDRLPSERELIEILDIEPAQPARGPAGALDAGRDRSRGMAGAPL